MNASSRNDKAPTRSRGRWLAAGLATLSLTIAAAGCSAILGGTSYECSSGAGSCPDDLTCNTVTHQCELATTCTGQSDCPTGDRCNSAGKCVSDSPDATTDGHPSGDDDDDDDDAGDASDGRSPGDTGTGTEGGALDGGGDGSMMIDSGPVTAIACDAGACPSGLFCATGDDLGNAFAQQCTRSCCTSADCISGFPSGFVCVPVGNTGSYCLPDLILTGSPPQTCCSNASCSGSSSECLFESGGPTGTSSFGCSGPAGTGQPGASCGDDEPACASGYCGSFAIEDPSYCRNRCCTAANCGGADAGFYCHVESAGTGDGDGKDYVSVCYDKHAENNDYLDLRNIGTACDPDNLDNGCKTGLCDDAGADHVARCVDTCCVDSDCPGGQVCRPRVSMDPPFLRCVTP